MDLDFFFLLFFFPSCVACHKSVIKELFSTASEHLRLHHTLISLQKLATLMMCAVLKVYDIPKPSQVINCIIHNENQCYVLVTITLINLFLIITAPVCLSRWKGNVYFRQCKISTAITLQTDNQSIPFQCFLSSVRGDT